MALLMLAVLIAAQQEAHVQTLAGETINGRVTSITDETITVATGAGDRALPYRNVLGVSFGAAAATTPPAARIKLIDDSLLLATSFTVTGSDASVVLTGGGEITIPTRVIDHVRFRDHSARRRINGPRLPRPSAAAT